MRHPIYLSNLLMLATITCVLMSCGNNTSKSATDTSDDSAWVETEIVEAVDSAQTNTTGIHEQEEERSERKVRNLMLGGHKLKGRVGSHKPMETVFTFYNDKTLTVDVSYDNKVHTHGGTWERKNRSYHDVEYEWCELRYRIADMNACAILDTELRLYGPIKAEIADQYNMAELCAIMADKSNPKNKTIQREITPLEVVENSISEVKTVGKTEKGNTQIIETEHPRIMTNIPTWLEGGRWIHTFIDPTFNEPIYWIYEFQDGQFRFIQSRDENDNTRGRKPFKYKVDNNIIYDNNGEPRFIIDSQNKILKSYSKPSEIYYKERIVISFD